MKVKKLIHKGWEEWENAPIEFKEKSIFGKKGWCGKYHYLYSSEKGEISLVKLKVGYLDYEKDLWLWEILELSANNLFSDTERFRTKKQAVERIKELLA